MATIFDVIITGCNWFLGCLSGVLQFADILYTSKKKVIKISGWEQPEKRLFRSQWKWYNLDQNNFYLFWIVIVALYDVTSKRRKNDWKVKITLFSGHLTIITWSRYLSYTFLSCILFFLFFSIGHWASI